MKKLLQLILILSILISTTAFRWYQKPHIPLSPNDIIPIEDASNDYSTSHILFSDIITYIDYIYQPLNSTLTSIAVGVINVDLDNTAYPWADNEIASSTNWNTAYTERREWDGSATHLVAGTGRVSLGLGTAATRDAEDSLTDGANLPDGHAIKIYGDSNWGVLGATYITQTSDSTLTNEQPLNALATGLLRSTNGTGVVDSIPISSDVEAMLGSDNDTALRTEIGAAASGTNSDITSLLGLTTPLTIVQGGTESANATGVRTNLGLVIGSDVQAYEATLTDISDGIITENIVNETYPWADNETSNILTLDWLQLSILTSAPSSPSVNRLYIADNDTWDPCDIAGTVDYYCIYTTGSEYSAILMGDGSIPITSIELPSFSHYATGDATYNDTTTPHVLTSEEMKNSIITNAGATQDRVYTCQPAGFGYNFMPMVIAAYQMDIEPDGNETLWLNGAQMAGGEHIINAADTKGDVMSCWSVESGDGTYEIFCKSDNSNWAQATP